MEPDASERIAAKINRKGEIMTQIELFLLLALLFAGAGCLLSLIALLRLGAHSPAVSGNSSIRCGTNWPTSCVKTAGKPPVPPRLRFPHSDRPWWNPSGIPPRCRAKRFPT